MKKYDAIVKEIGEVNGDAAEELLKTINIVSDDLKEIKEEISYNTTIIDDEEDETRYIIVIQDEDQIEDCMRRTAGMKVLAVF